MTCQAQNNISSLDDRIFCGVSQDGMIVSSFDGGTFCGVSQDGMIVSSFDGGSSWQTTDFNDEYEGFYPQMSFVAAAAGAKGVAVAGTGSDGLPHLFVSAEGAVWSERELSYLAHGSPVFIQASPKALAYAPSGDQFLLILDDGTTLLLPPCSHCNQLLDSSVASFLLPSPAP